MGTLLALGSAALYGISDFVGGLLSRRAGYLAITVWGYLCGLAFAVAAAVVVSRTADLDDLAWGALSGVGSGIGTLFLFRGLSHGAMAVVVPISAVCGMGIPVLVGVLVGGERPSVLAWVGVAVALPALWLVAGASDGSGRRPTAALDGLAAGVGIALQYAALAQADAESGIWPVAAGRAAAVVALLPLVFFRPASVSLSLPPRIAAGAGATIVMAVHALIAYQVAAQLDLDVVAVVLSSLYPVVPVALGIVVLHERPSRRQTLGLAGAGASIAMLVAR